MPKLKHPTTDLTTPHGGVQATAPIIISASRSTDIPAFHTNWFLSRLREGYCVWKNPFNQKRHYVSFSNTRAVVFWTKNPAPLLARLSEFESYGFTYYFQFTLNDYESEQLEPHVPPLEERIETFQRLSEAIGKERVIWRFDPIVLPKRLDVHESTDRVIDLAIDHIVDRIEKLGDRLSPFTEKLVFSFIRIAAYTKVQNNLRTSDVREPTDAEIPQLYEALQKLASRWGIQLAACSERIAPELYGIERSRCIDPALLLRLCRNNVLLSDVTTCIKH